MRSGQPREFEGTPDRIRNPIFSTKAIISVALLLSVGGLLCGGLWFWIAPEPDAPSPRPVTEATSYAKRELADRLSGKRRPKILQIDPSASLNPAFDDRYMKDVALSPAGYPIIVVEQAVAVCTDPFRLQLALDLIVARRPDDVDKVPNCVLLTPGMEAEWTKSNAFGKYENELRVPIRGDIPITVYGPSRDGKDQRFFRWFSTYPKEE
jgi:hypothetical protein